ncbi:MAG: ribonuclease HI [Candidatus Pacebacteria bacterium]|nr:ribonuclease HI [Candidatus Paceibacterota bacterium]MCF7862655.1 ribonuclease HI [Candidatus Paceibacterota bacterium]
MSKEKIIVYTDGSARGNPGPAGWGAILIVGNKIFEMGGRSDRATNNQMELTAGIEGVRKIRQEFFGEKDSLGGGDSFSGKNEFEIEIFSDSKYVILGITEWIHGWIKNNWRNSAKKPVLNKELWEELYSVTRGLNITWKYVAGHTGDTYNERADEIATSFADNEPTMLKNAG